MAIPILPLAAAILLLWAPSASDSDWRQWGGPGRNFTVEGTALAGQWPAEGPRRLWERDLGEGHSAIVTEGDRIYTMYRPLGLLSLIRRSRQETVAAFDANSGRTVWEYTYDAPLDGLDFSQGAGPHSTPLLVGDLLYAMSSRVQLFALDKRTGSLAWSHDLMKELGARLDSRGHSPSPIAYRSTVIVPAGGPGSAVVAFDQKTGATVWKGGDFAPAPASPILITVDGQEQLVVLGHNEIVGMDPRSGGILWTHPHSTSWGLNISTPVWGPDNLLLVSSAYNNGTRLLHLTQAGGKTTVQERWYQNRMRVHIGTVIRLGDFAVGASGDFGPCPTTAIDIQSGRVLWQSREFARATFVHAGGRLIVLDEDGNLGLATADRGGLKVLAKSPILSSQSWTTPTLAGTRLYVRDRRVMMALDLGR